MKYPALLFVGAVNLLAQMGATTPTAGSGGQTSVQANPGPASDPRALYISGKVTMQDASPVAQVTIERVCAGISKTVAYTNSNGRFNFQWGDRKLIVTDASDAGSGRRGTPARAASVALNRPAAPTRWPPIRSGTA